MLARASDDIPVGTGWLYEPKWDGFRAIIFRDGSDVTVLSRNGLDLGRYFPEIVEVAHEALPPRIVVDGEIVIATRPTGLDFDALQMRLHPAASRIARLSTETPASFVAFDLLAEGERDLRQAPLSERRSALERALIRHPRAAITPQTSDVARAQSWFLRYEGAGLDGVVAKPASLAYIEGERGWTKIKHHRTADCVVGGYRLATGGGGIGSLLLGLYDADGVLHHVGHTSSFNAAQRRETLTLLEPLEGGPSFGEGRTPGRPSRWSNGKDVSWVPVRPELVCEVHFDQLQGRRFRHASRFLRWRADKSPHECDYAQLQPPHPFRLRDIVQFGGET